jgi:hypothetical protein
MRGTTEPAPYSGTTPDATNSQITVGSAGVYRVDVMMESVVVVSGTIVGAYLNYHLFKNGSQATVFVLNGSSFMVNSTVSNRFDRLVFTGFITLAANDVLDIRADWTDFTGTADIQFTKGVLSVTKVG